MYPSRKPRNEIQMRKHTLLAREETIKVLLQSYFQTEILSWNINKCLKLQLTIILTIVDLSVAHFLSNLIRKMSI